MKKLTAKQKIILISAIILLGVLGIIVLFLEHRNRQLYGLRYLVLACLMIVNYVVLRLQGYRKRFSTIISACAAILNVLFAVLSFAGK